MFSLFRGRIYLFLFSRYRSVSQPTPFSPRPDSLRPLTPALSFLSYRYACTVRAKAQPQIRSSAAAASMLATCNKYKRLYWFSRSRPWQFQVDQIWPEKSLCFEKNFKKKQTKQTQKPKRIADNRALNITQPVFEHMQMQRRSCSLHIHILIEYAPHGPCTHFWKSVGV